MLLKMFSVCHIYSMLDAICNPPQDHRSGVPEWKEYIVCWLKNNMWNLHKLVFVFWTVQSHHAMRIYSVHSYLQDLPCTTQNNIAVKVIRRVTTWNPHIPYHAFICWDGNRWDVPASAWRSCLWLFHFSVQKNMKVDLPTSSGVCTGAEVWLSLQFAGTEAKKNV
jgi:hypothetical protein